MFLVRLSVRPPVNTSEVFMVFAPDSRNDPITLKKVIGSLIYRQLTISRSDRIPRTILPRSDHDPGDSARYVDRCWIRNVITTIGNFISNITIVNIYKLTRYIYWNLVCLVSTVCIFSMTLITYTYLSNMALGIILITDDKNSFKLVRLMFLEHLLKWLDCGHSFVISLPLPLCHIVKRVGFGRFRRKPGRNGLKLDILMFSGSPS